MSRPRSKSTDLAAHSDRDSVPTASRRRVLQAAGAGALALGGTSPGAAAHDDGLPALAVDGPRIVDASGEEVTLRGVTVADPKLVDRTAPARGKDALQVIDRLTDTISGWHPTVVRIRVRPRTLAEYGPVGTTDVVPPGQFDESDLRTYCDEHLDPVVDRLADAGVYALVSFYRDPGGNLDWRDSALQSEVELFWSVVAPRYAGRDHVLFDLYGYPTGPTLDADPTADEDATAVWRDWKATAQPWVDLVRDHADNVVVVGSPGANFGVGGVALEQFDGYNLAYAYHCYPGIQASREQRWSELGPAGNGTGGVEEEVPLFVTAWGWDAADSQYGAEPGSEFHGTAVEFGEPFLEWMESRTGVYWTANLADPGPYTPLFTRPFTTRTPWDLREVDPTSGTVPELCPELPCEWQVLGGEVGDGRAHPGGYVRDALQGLQEDVHLAPPDVERLPAPSSLAVADRTSTSLTLDWSPVEEADRYAVVLDGTRQATVQEPGVALDGLESGRRYRVGVRALSAGEASRSARTELTVRTAESDCERSVTVNDRTVCDPDGDDLYEDFDASGDLSQTDVVEFFQVQHREAWKQPSRFDFTGNDAVDHGDVVGLFEEVVASTLS